MSASSSQQSKKPPPKKTIRRLKIQVEVDNSNQKTKTEEGEDRKVGTSTIKNSAMSGIIQTTVDEARSKLVQSVADFFEKIAKDSQDRTVTQKLPELQHEVGMELSELVRFGPFYGADSASIQKAKEAAWDHIVQKSGPDADAERTYKLEVKKIEERAMEMYDIPEAEKPKPEQFRQMMVRDGCFFLLLALHILGGGHLLKYPSDHLYFGKHIDSTIWIHHMFFVGNQIPYDIIRVLMKQTFFMDVINEGIQSRTWYCPDETNIAKMALYLTVVKPAFWNRMSEEPPLHFNEPEPPSNILEGLHNLFVGNRTHDSKDLQKEFEKLEAGSSDDKIKIPCARELSKKRIYLASNKTPGIKNIRFRNHLYCAKIFLPVLTIQSHTKEILANLVKHEQNLNESDREVTAYIRFMRDLVRTSEDVKLLQDEKIIHVKDENFKGTIIGMFDDLFAIQTSNFTVNFRHISQKITDYGGPPWGLIGGIVSLLTIIQTIFTIVTYSVDHSK